MNSSIKYYYLLFIISPFMAFALALRKGFDKRYQGIILAFSFLYGYSVYLYSGDVLRYETTYAAVVEYTWSDFWFILTHKLDPVALNTYAPNSINRKPDIFALIVSFLSSRITDSPRLFWGIVSLVYTWFMLLFFNEAKKQFNVVKGSWIHYLLIFFFIIVIPKYVGVTGVRFWPALFLFMYFLMRYIRSGSQLKYLAYTALSTLVHYSFFVPVLLIIIFHFVPFKKIVSPLLVLVSLLFFLLSSTTGVFNLLEKAVESTDDTTIGQSIEGYTDQDAYELKKSKSNQTNWYVQFRSRAHLYLFLFVFGLELFNVVSLKETSFSKQMYPILILFFCLSLVTLNLGSIGRYKNIFILLVLLRYVILLPINQASRFFKILGVILTPIVLVYFVVLMRAELYFVESYLVVNNSISIFFIRANESLSELLVGH